MYNRRIVVILVLLFLPTSFHYCFSKKPEIIPSIKKWVEGKGSYYFKNSTSIVIDPKYHNELISIASTLQEDLNSLKNYNYLIKISNNPQKNDIYLTLNSSYVSARKDAYVFDISDNISIIAKDKLGVFYGTRTLLQLLKQSDTIQMGTVYDWSSYDERGMMVDNGRKYFTIDWLVKHIKELAYLKMNIFHFHFSDYEGFRIESDKYPFIVSKEYYTKKEIKELLEIAEKYYVTIIPELDVPAHFAYVLNSFYPTYNLQDKDGNYSCYLDIISKESRLFVKSLIEEYMELFPGPYWHSGCDEFNNNLDDFPSLKKFAQEKYGPNAKSIDAYVDFINWIDSIAIAKGKTLRIWNDIYELNNNSESQSTLKLNDNIIIEYWFGKKNINEIISNGHKVFNCNGHYLYYVLGTNWKTYDKLLFSEWKPNIFYKNQVVEDTNKVLGSKLLIWCDKPKEENEIQIAKQIKTNLRFISQWNWNPSDTTFDYDTFCRRIELIDFSPGVSFPKNATPDNLAYGKRVVASSQEPNSNFFPDNIVDSDSKTRWSSAFSDSEWIYIDFEKSTNITRVKIQWEYAFSKEYVLQVSDDTINWKTIFNETNGCGGDVDIPKIEANGRYLRLLSNKKNGIYGISLYEIEVYDSTAIQNDVLDDNFSIDEFDCYPNPFSSSININYLTNRYSKNLLQIFNLQGELISEVVNKFENAGSHSCKWIPLYVKNGIYICKLSVDGKSTIKKIIYMSD